MSDAVDNAFTSWENDVDQTNSLYDQKQYQVDRLENLLALMGQVPASVAFNLLIPASMLMVSNQNTTDMEIQASMGNEESDVLTLINITQADNNYLASNSATYQQYIGYQNHGTTVYATPNHLQPISTPYFLVYNSSDPSDPYIYNSSNNQPIYAPNGQQLTVNEENSITGDYEDAYNEANEAQADLLRIFQDNNPELYPKAQDPEYAGWCEDNYASSMIAAINSWKSATDDLSAPDADNPGQSSEYYYSEHMQQYAQDPASSMYATDVSNLTTSINTEQSSNNSIQSQIQGIIKSLMTLAQQYEGSTKSAGKSVIQEKDYWVQQQGKNS